jgi:hypothetical protein
MVPRLFILASLAFSMLLALPATLRPQAASQIWRDFEALPFAPRHYVCYRASSRPRIDGKVDEAAWRAALWTDLFVDIEGDSRPRPRLRTRAKMLWDADYFYVAADMEEPDIWGTLIQRDSIIYNDNDLELFIDPDGDTQMYCELEVNPLGTVFDLMLPRTYRDGGPPIIAWDIAGLQVGVDTRGTVNRPGDRDEGWTVEIAMPWRILREAAPGKRPPQPGEQWRVNLSRVEWQADAKEGRYTRRTDPSTGKPLPSDNWVWSPQGAIDIHMPERWGYVQFSGIEAGVANELFVEDPNERVKWALRRLYYRQRRFRDVNGRYADDLAVLHAADIRMEGLEFAPSMQATRDLYRIAAKGFGGAVVHIQHDGKVWLTR